MIIVPVIWILMVATVCSQAQGFVPPSDVLANKFNDLARPWPVKVEPKPEAELAANSRPPSGAKILFNGKDLSAWQPSQWKLVEGDAVEIVPKSGYLVSNESFGSCRLHLEWWTPSTPPLKKGQDRGNSGIFFMGQYEVQVLDSYDDQNNKTYADGIAGSVYGQYPPLVNPIRPPGNWQYYDIEFRRPIFNAAGEVVRPARFTVDFNGHRVQDNVVLVGPTNPPGRRPYKAHDEALPLRLQDHKEVVRYRNIWIQPLAD